VASNWTVCRSDKPPSIYPWRGEEKVEPRARRRGKIEPRRRGEKGKVEPRRGGGKGRTAERGRGEEKVVSIGFVLGVDPGQPKRWMIRGGMTDLRCADSGGSVRSFPVKLLNVLCLGWCCCDWSFLVPMGCFWFGHFWCLFGVGCWAVGGCGAYQVVALLVTHWRGLLGGGWLWAYRLLLV
jgi:hypothetical protein